MAPQLFEHDERSYMLSSEEITWGGTLAVSICSAM